MGISYLNELGKRETNKTPFTDTLLGREKPLDEPTDFLSYMGNLARNIPNLVAASFDTTDPTTKWIGDKLYRNAPEERAQVAIIKKQLEQARLQGGDTWRQVMEDLTPKNFFSKLNSKLEGIGSVGDLIAGIPQSLVGMAVAPLEAASGVGVSERRTTVLTPEERADKIKETAAIVISTAAGVVTRLGATAVIGRKIPGGLKTPVHGIAEPLPRIIDPVLADLSKVVIGKLARKVIIGGSEGVVAGVSFGAVARANREDQLTSMLVSIPFAALGIGMEMLRIDKIDKALSRADDLFNLRQMQYTPEKSLFEISKDIESLATADNLALAVASGKINTGKSHTIISGVTKDGLKKIDNSVDIPFYDYIAYKTGDNAFDILVTPKDLEGSAFLKIRDSFNKTGHIPNEVVSYKGKDWIFTGQSVKDVAKVGDTGLVLREAKTGKTDTALLSEVSRKPDFDLHNPTVLIESEMSLKGQILATAKNKAGDYYDLQASQSHPFYETNLKANDNVTTGKPITFVGMRVDRGQGLVNTGVFHALTLEHLTGYKGGKWQGNTPEQIAQVKKIGGSNLGMNVPTPGKETIPGIIDANLRVRRLSFENPFVFEGKHHQLIKDVTHFYDQYDTIVKDQIIGTTQDWSKVFTKQEMAAIKEAGSLEKKPVGIPTQKYIENKKMTAGSKQYTYGLEAGKTHPESHYAIVDRIIAKAMRRNNHDAFVYKSSIHNTEVVDLRTGATGTLPSFDKPKATVTGLKSNVINAERFIDKLYDEFKQKDLFTGPSDKGFPAQDIPWNDAFTRFAGDRGILPEELSSLKRNFLERLHNEAVESLPEIERSVYKKAIEDNPLVSPTESFENLRRSTNANNMYFDSGDAGTIVLRDRTSNKELLRTQSPKEAEEFISRSGQERGIDLDGNRADPPIFPSTPGDLPFPNEIPELHKAGRLEQFIAWVDSSTPWMSASRNTANAIDVTYKTSLAARIHDPLQVAIRQAHANAKPWLERLKNEVEKFVINDSKEGRATVSNYNETVTPAQMLERGIGGRKLNDLEQQAAKQFSEVDITNLFKFRRRVGNIQKQFKRGTPERAAAYEAARKEFSIGEKELDAFKTMSAMRKMPLENASIGNSVRLARALQDEGKGVILDRELYAAKNMTASQLAAAKAMEKLSADLAEKFGIPNDKMLPNYFTHARLYNGGEISDVLKLFKSNKAADDFYAGLVRTGEIDAYERDPIIAMRRYILAGFNHQHLTPAINASAKILKEELLKIPDTARPQVERIVNQYISDIRGMPTVADNFTQNAFDTFMGKVGVKTSVNIRREVINSILSTITGSTQGFRVVQGLRDFYANTRNIYGRLGVTRTARVFELGANRELQAAYLRDGVIQGYGVLQFATPLEQELGVIGRSGHKVAEGLNRFSQAGMKLSGQPSVFELFQTGVYAEARESSARISREIVEGKHGKLDSPETYKKAYASIEMDAFDRSTQIQYDKLIQGGQYEKAADFLGRQSVAEVIGMYGNANHPTGWNSNVGRIGSQFGTWPTNYRHYLGRLASQGDVGNRTKRLARVAVMDLALTAVAAKTGISFYNWTTLPSVAFQGGPSIDAIQTVFDATVGYGVDQDLAIARLKGTFNLHNNDGTWNLKHLLIPGSFFADDLAKAYDLGQSQPGMGALRGLGMKVEGDNYEAGAIETYFQEQFGR